MGLISGSVVSSDAMPRIDMEYGKVMHKLARIQRALRASRRLLESVPHVAMPGDTDGVLSVLENAEVDCSDLREAI